MVSINSTPHDRYAIIPVGAAIKQGLRCAAQQASAAAAGMVLALLTC